jgi:hypothetical protein
VPNPRRRQRAGVFVDKEARVCTDFHATMSAGDILAQLVA